MVARMGATITDAITDARADAVFGALSDATRRDILSRTMGRGLGISELAATYPMSFAAVQKHVAVLERAGLVRKHPEGRRRVVTTDIDGLRAARLVLDHYEARWRGRVGRMQDLIDAEPPANADLAHQEHRR